MDKFEKLWNIAVPIILTERDMQDMKITDLRNDPLTLAKIAHAYETIQATITSDRVEGPIIDDEKLSARIAEFEPEWDQHWINRWLKYASVRRLLKKILKFEAHDELLRAMREGRIYIKHYHYHPKPYKPNTAKVHIVEE